MQSQARPDLSPSLGFNPVCAMHAGVQVWEALATSGVHSHPASLLELPNEALAGEQAGPSAPHFTDRDDGAAG